MEELALANRPLPSVKEGCECMYNKKGKPVASQDIYKSNLFSIQTNYNEKEGSIIPVSIKQNKINNDFMVLEGDIYDKVEEYARNDKSGIRTNLDDKKKVSKMDFSTQFYVGSLTVIGLFVFFRLIQKTR